MLPCDALVVDDDPEGRDALAQVLEAHGCTVRRAENGRVALDEIAARLPCILVLDLQMPVMDGWEVLASLRRAGATEAITIVVLSAEASAPPGVTFLPKPCRVEDLLVAVAIPDHRHAPFAGSPPGDA